MPHKTEGILYLWSQLSEDFNHVSLTATLLSFLVCKLPYKGKQNFGLTVCKYKGCIQFHRSALPPEKIGSQPSTSHLLICAAHWRWSQDANEARQGCLEAADWDALWGGHRQYDDCITDYITFCVENTISTKTMQCFPNNKPWVTSDMKELLNKKKRAFKDRDRDKPKSWEGSLDGANKLNMFFNCLSSGSPAALSPTNPDLAPPLPQQYMFNIYSKMIPLILSYCW